jgi:hypothetical protein
VGYSILFSYYEIVEEEVQLIDEYKLPYIERKESLETLLCQQNYEFIGNVDLWGIRTNSFMSIAEIVKNGSGDA